MLNSDLEVHYLTLLVKKTNKFSIVRMGSLQILWIRTFIHPTQKLHKKYNYNSRLIYRISRMRKREYLIKEKKTDYN